MPNKGNWWKPEDDAALNRLYMVSPAWENVQQIANRLAPVLGRSSNSIRTRIFDLQSRGELPKVRIDQSPYPVYDSPLVMEGDALVLGDIEFPFHHAEFMSRCLDLAAAWGIKQAILAGDVLHYDSLSGFGPNWKEEQHGGMSAEAERRLMDEAEKLPPAQREKIISAIAEIGIKTESDGISTELGIARKGIKSLSEQFDKIDFVIGNHEGRFLRIMDTELEARELLIQLCVSDNPKWRIAPYYFSYLDTPGGRYLIEHPKNSGKGSAAALAAKYHCHILMAHDHHLVFQLDVSGQYFAYEIGHCVDEARLAYAAQRHNKGAAHSLGACIVRDGVPWLLHPRVDWKRLAGM